MRKDAHLEIGLRWRREEDAFDVSVEYDQPNDAEDRRDLGSTPVIVDTSRLAQLLTDEAAYGRELAERLFASPQIRRFYAKAKGDAEQETGLRLHLRLLLDPNAPLRQGTTMFLVPHDTPGFRIGKVFNKSGWRFYQNGEMIFENARVPHANVVGPVNGSDMKTQQAGDRTGGDLFGDLELAANALGVCDDACGMALRLARTKKQGGRLLFEQQVVQLKLNRMHLLTEALRGELRGTPSG